MRNMNYRKRTQALEVSQFNDGKTVKLGSSWFARKKDNKVKIYKQTSPCKFDQVTKACFNLTMRRSKEFPTEIIKTNLRRFCEQEKQ